MPLTIEHLQLMLTMYTNFILLGSVISVIFYLSYHVENQFDVLVIVNGPN